MELSGSEFNNPELHAREGFVMLPCWLFIRTAWPKEYIRHTLAGTTVNGDYGDQKTSHHYFRSPFEGYTPKDLILMFDYYKQKGPDLPRKVFSGEVDVEEVVGQYTMDLLIEDLDTLFRRNLITTK